MQSTQTARDKALSDIAAGSLSMPGTGPMTAEEAEQKSKTTYTGPTEIDAGTMSGLYGGARGLQQQSQAAGTNAGRATLLAQKYGPTSWGGGQLDAALSGAGSAGGRLAGAAGAYGRLLGNIGNTQAGVRQAATGAKESTAAAAKAYEGAIPGLKQKEQEVKDAETARLEAERQAALAAQQELDATENAGGGGSYVPGSNARRVAEDKNSRGQTPTPGVGMGRGVVDTSGRYRPVYEDILDWMGSWGR